MNVCCNRATLCSARAGGRYLLLYGEGGEAAARVVLELASRRDKGDFLSNGGLVASRVGRRHAREGADEVLYVSDGWEVGGRAAPDRDADAEAKAEAEAEAEAERREVQWAASGSAASIISSISTPTVEERSLDGPHCRKGKARCSRSRGRRARTGVGTRPSLRSGPVATLTAKVWSLRSLERPSSQALSQHSPGQCPLVPCAWRRLEQHSIAENAPCSLLLTTHCSTLMQTRRHVGSLGASSFIPHVR
jgi:hypothetical protein